MTALFVVMFIDQWEDAQDHKPALVGIVCSVICLVIFGRGKFILPSMASIVLCFLGMKKHEENVYRSQENIRHDSWDIYSRTGGIRNDYDNNTADHNGCGSGPGNYDNAIFALYHISGRKGTAGCDHLSGKSAALCSDRIAGGILSEGCAGKYLLLTARADRNTVHCGIT